MAVELALRQAQKGLLHAVGVHGTNIITEHIHAILGCCEDDGLLQHVCLLGKRKIDTEGKIYWLMLRLGGLVPLQRCVLWVCRV
jgi:hypothetical protein